MWWRFDLALCRLAVEYALGRLAAVDFCVLEVVVCVYRWWGLGLFFCLVVAGGCVWWCDGGWVLEVVGTGGCLTVVCLRPSLRARVFMRIVMRY